MSTVEAVLRTEAIEPVFLSPQKKGLRAESFEQQLSERIVGQDQAVQRMSSLYQVFLAGMNSGDRPIGTMLFLGPSGSGKTRLVEAAAEALFGSPNAMIKVDCAEFQHSHEIAKLLGSPPGYLGHRETSPLLTQKNLDTYHTDETHLSLLLFDEIEKASDSLWQLLLGILDKGRLTLGDNQRTDFSQTIVVMTSNLGAREMSELVSGGIGFGRVKESKNKIEPALEEKVNRTALEAARRKFSPEFMNRIDKVVVFRSLSEDHLRQILDLELQTLQDRIMTSARTKFLFKCSDEAKERLLNEGIDVRYGARHLKRAIERLLVYPLSNLAATDQVEFGDFVLVDFDSTAGEMTFSKISAGAFTGEENELAASSEETKVTMAGVGTSVPAWYAALWPA